MKTFETRYIRTGGYDLVTFTDIETGETSYLTENNSFPYIMDPEEDFDGTTEQYQTAKAAEFVNGTILAYRENVDFSSLPVFDADELKSILSDSETEVLYLETINL